MNDRKYEATNEKNEGCGCCDETCPCGPSCECPQCDCEECGCGG